MNKFKTEFELIAQIETYRKKFQMLNQGMQRGVKPNLFFTQPAHAVMTSFRQFLHSLGFNSERFRWRREGDLDIVSKLNEVPSFNGGMQVLRYLSMREDYNDDQAWTMALRSGLIDWTLRGLIEQPADRVRDISRCVSFV